MNDDSIDKRVLLVTGCPRSGTTWVGRVIATAPQTGYLLEPLNVTRAHKYFSLPVTSWYQHITEENDAEFRGHFRDLLNGRATPRGDALHWRDIGRPATVAAQWFRRHRQRHVAANARRMVIKDPISLLSAKWFAARFDALPVIVIRRPAAVVASIRSRGWLPDVDEILNQPGVRDKFFPDFDRWRAQHPKRPHHDPALYQGAVLWRLLHQVILKYQAEHPDWCYVCHEEISRQPTTQFQQLFARLDLPYLPRTDSFVAKTTSRRDSARGASSTSNVVRDTQANIDAWKQHLTATEIGLIDELTHDVAEHFYSPED